MTALYHLESNHFRAVVESYAYRKVHSSGEIRFLSLIARPGTMRSLIANLYIRELTTLVSGEHDETRLLIQLPNHDAGWAFRTFHSPMPSGLLSTLLLPTQATQYGVTFEQPALIIDRRQNNSETTPPDSFFPVLNKLVPFPILQDWCPLLWQWGLRDQWITKLTAHPYPAYDIRPRCHELQSQIAKGLMTHELPVTTERSQIAPPSVSSRVRERTMPCI